MSLSILGVVKAGVAFGVTLLVWTIDTVNKSVLTRGAVQ
jgi:hypothetical protein